MERIQSESSNHIQLCPCTDRRQSVDRRPDNTQESVEDLETVEKALKEHYCTAGELTFYTACSCVIKRGHDEHTSTSNEIIGEQFFKSNKRVIIIGEEGFGKTYLLQYVLQQWATGIILNDVILIYIKLESLSRNSCILEEVVKSTKGKIQSTKAISSALQEKDALVLLDGVQNFPLEDNPQTSNLHNSNPLTVESLLNNTYHSMFPNLKVWSTFRPKVGGVTFKTPYTSVNLDGFSEPQRKTYWRNTVEVFKQICLKATTYGDLIGESSVQALLSESELTKLMEASWDNTFQQLDMKVTKSPLLAYIFLLGYLGKMDFDLTENVCILALCKKWKIADWCPKFKGKDVLFDRDNLYYSKELMNGFCTSCLNFQVTLGNLTFCGNYPTYSCLPDVDGELKFEYVELPQKYFFNLIQHYAGKSLKITFIETAVSITKQQIQQTNKEKYAGLTVCSEKGKKKYQFNFNAANWESEDGKTAETRVESSQ
ncbi:hypothetical protein BSL78_06484 [Apostichopus japonicus]|uniref:NACHT domain-containing protein n=1 Tax=Stichopus japonicus TaxID=307972 RepID=A0A2G8L8N6_STIJA|nr:hypothetical protein BSL78_06484 [Apostichopus japonicus]